MKDKGFYIFLAISLLFFLAILIIIYFQNNKKIILSPVQIDAFKVYDLVNDHRAKKGLNKLLFDPSMCEFANARLNQIHINYSHEGFDPEVYNYYDYKWTGENLGKGYMNNEDIIEAWINSPTHLKNIIDPNFTRTCIASDNYQNITYIVQEFASW